MLSRKIFLNLLCTGLTACFSFCMQTALAQQVQTITDRREILIGEQIQLKIKTNLPVNPSPSARGLILPDSIPHFEIVEAAKPDTIHFKDNSQAIEQTISITSFDSGRWVFPALGMELGTAGQDPRLVQTDSFFVNVSYSPPDSTNELRDIKPIINVTVINYKLYYIIGGVILLLVLIYLLYRYFKKRKKSLPGAGLSSLSPYDEAMEELKKLSQLNLQDPAEIKIYHTGLAFIFRNYLWRKRGASLMNKTTGDLLINIKDAQLPAEAVFNLATALRLTDAVKFAKYLPAITQSDESLQIIKETIEITEQKIPAQTGDTGPQTQNPNPKS